MIGSILTNSFRLVHPFGHLFVGYLYLLCPFVGVTFSLELDSKCAFSFVSIMTFVDRSGLSFSIIVYICIWIMPYSAAAATCLLFVTSLCCYPIECVTMFRARHSLDMDILHNTHNSRQRSGKPANDQLDCCVWNKIKSEHCKKSCTVAIYWIFDGVSAIFFCIHTPRVKDLLHFYQDFRWTSVKS